MVTSITGADKTADAVKETVLREIPAKIRDVSVTAVRRNSRAGCVTLVTKSKEDRDKLIASTAFKDFGLAAKEAPHPGHEVVIYKMPSHITDDELIAELSLRNSDPDIAQADWEKEISIRRGTGKTESTGTVVVNVSSRVLKYWKVLGRLDVHWQTYQFRQPSGVELCFKCFGYGHGIGSCKSQARLCVRCGEAEHLLKDCKNAESCRNCRMAGKADQHGVKSNKCPFYHRATERIKSLHRNQE